MAIKSVTTRDAREKQAAGYTYVDVRSVPEFEQGHPEGAVNVPLLDRDPRTGQMTPNPAFLAVMQKAFAPDAKILVGCQAGGRSLNAVQVLEAAGFTNATNVLGGFGGGRDPLTGESREGWVACGLPVESGSPDGRAYKDLRDRK